MTENESTFDYLIEANKGLSTQTIWLENYTPERLDRFIRLYTKRGWTIQKKAVTVAKAVKKQ